MKMSITLAGFYLDNKMFATVREGEPGGRVLSFTLVFLTQVIFKFIFQNFADPCLDWIIYINFVFNSKLT